MRYTQSENEGLEFIESFRQKAAELRIPVSGSIEITKKCNLSCVHCFIGKDAESEARELSTERWISIIDELTAAGCLNLLITGGEPLLNKGFDRIYAHAKNAGLLVTVFTNGTMLDENRIKLFKELPPQALEITLYAATADKFDSITLVKGSYERCIRGIKLLSDNGINLKLKTVLMTENIDEFEEIENLSAAYGTSFRLDAALFPRLDHNKAPLNFRVPPRKAVEKEMSEPARLEQWKNYYEKRKGVESGKNRSLLYKCSAGLTSFHIDSFGILKPCLMTNSANFDLSESSFLKGWKEVLPLIRKKTAGNGFKCGSCDKLAVCGYCPAFFELETGKEYLPSEYLCKTAQYRYEAIF